MRALSMLSAMSANYYPRAFEKNRCGVPPLSGHITGTREGSCSLKKCGPVALTDAEVS